MTVPQECWRASRDFEHFMLTAREALDHATTNQTYGGYPAGVNVAN